MPSPIKEVRRLEEAPFTLTVIRENGEVERIHTMTEEVNDFIKYDWESVSPAFPFAGQYETIFRRCAE